MSPLMRTLETAAGVFGGGSETAQPLMLRQTGTPREWSAHDAIGQPSRLPIIATEMCRERMGNPAIPQSCYFCMTMASGDADQDHVLKALPPRNKVDSLASHSVNSCFVQGPNPCDQRRPLHLTKEHFPGVDFSAVQTDEDVLWKQVHAEQHTSGEYDVGESEDAVTVRGIRFLRWLMTRSAPALSPVKKLTGPSNYNDCCMAEQIWPLGGHVSVRSILCQNMECPRALCPPWSLFFPN